MRYRDYLLLLLAVAVLLSSGCQVKASSATSRQDSAQLVNASQGMGFNDWVADFRRQAGSSGIDAATLAAAFDSVRYQPSIIEFDRSQPEFTRPVWEYLDTAVSQSRVKQGRARLEEHRPAIEIASKRYGVPKGILVAIWGIESNYGSNFGDFSTINALSTLGYDGRRPELATRELMAALRILQRGDIDRAHMRGSWAGAMGHTQFLPSSFEAYARDADGDGRRDIWGNIADVMASTANYLAEAGWHSGAPWGMEVRLPEGFDYAQTELANRQSSQAWAAQGVEPMRGGELPDLSDAAVIVPAGAHGPAFLVGHNFRMIMRYNASTSYALAVALLSDRIKGRSGVVADWPRGESVLSRTQVKQLQVQLNARGFDVGEPDGIMGPNTRRGLRGFQASLGMIPDGFATQRLLRKLSN